MKFSNFPVKKFLYLILILLLATGAFFYEWVYYMAHLAKHQIHIFTQRYSIEEILNERCVDNTQEVCQTDNLSLSKKAIRKLELIVSAKKYARKIYELGNLNVYKNLVPLDRHILGWNITVAYPLELKVKKFYFPFIGKFGYLGFFDTEVLEYFEKKYLEKGFDIYRSVVGGYTSLGYFEDPIFSTYLNFSDYHLVRLIFHEMAHLKLYFDDDTFFSESLASYIEKHAAENFVENFLKRKITQMDPIKLKHEYAKFNLIIRATEKRLIELFSQKIKDNEKLSQKKMIYESFREQVKKMSKENQYLKLDRLLRLKEINNAALIQYFRYSPPKKSKFSTVFEETCKKDFPCWFKELEKLKKLSAAERKSWLYN